MLRACGADEKERMAIAIHNLKVAVHMVVFPVGGLEAKNARHSGESRVFQEAHGANKNDEQRSDKREQSKANGPISLRLRVQKVVFLMEKAMG